MFNRIKQQLRSLISHEVRMSLLSNEMQEALYQQNIQFDIRAERFTAVNMSSKEKGISDEHIAPCEVIVSLTTYGRRLHDVYLTIESIMQGSVRPNRIILWLQEDYMTMPLPSSLLRLQTRGLEIEYCQDLKSYKKLIPALTKYTEACIITIDDDVIYDVDMLECLLNSWHQHPECIHAHRVHQITTNSDGTIKKYSDWTKCTVPDGEPAKYLLFTGVGGVLYPPHCLADETTDIAMFQQLAPWADDLWFYCMARKKGTLICKTPSRSEDGQLYVTNYRSQGGALWTRNVSGGNNDTQLAAILNHFGITL